MGCSESREIPKVNHQKSKSVNENEGSALYLCAQAERNLQISQFPSEDLDNYFHRYSYAEELTIENLNKVSHIIGFDTLSKETFYAQFIINKLAVRQSLILNSRRICTLSIILGRSDESEKLRLLFKNYDLDANKNLDKKEILLLIDDVLWVFLYAIPQYAKSLEPQNSILNDGVTKMANAHEYIKSELFSRFLDKETSVTIESYMKKFGKKDLKIILYPNRIRHFALEVMDKMLMKEKDCEDEKKRKEKEKEKEKIEIESVNSDKPTTDNDEEENKKDKKNNRRTRRK
ncbi:hypothetical protein SteCoe_26286 [Stentor coeruleus]|uniref:EF-hand domain-containing protein n=1 Tax=Stentor coeruleus TaxID=5963 RepID=A0A1R2BDA4_9CILI|nr:hypothetical protein SteCoe_26286 [Stentor coeruleus]